MDRRVRTAALVALAVLALGATAATVDSLDSASGGDREPQTPAEPQGTATPVDDDDDRGGGTDIGCPGPLDSTLGLVLGLAAVGLFGVVAYRLVGSVLPALVVAPPVVLWLVTSCGTIPPVAGSLFGAVGAVFEASMLLVGVALLALVGAVVLFLVKPDFGSFTADELTAEDPPGGTDLSGVGDAAGAAADRIETQADVSNEVYRAWVEMTDHLEVANPDATTAEEFAAVAVDAGMASDDVERLTDLFRDVRYGGADPDTRAEEAVATLRRIERTYGSESP